MCFLKLQCCDLSGPPYNKAYHQSKFNCALGVLCKSTPLAQEKVFRSKEVASYSAVQNVKTGISSCSVDDVS